MLQRRHNFQTVSWFWDLKNRTLLNLDPPYQRRSVWNQDFKDYFIDTILLAYPAPSVFIYEEISPSGESRYNVVDGKQRLSAVFEFAANLFPVSDRSSLHELRGKYFETFSDDLKKQFWSYQFTVEYLPTSDEQIINEIFDRINRNVAKLTQQELRHARFSGIFITKAEELAESMSKVLPGLPRLTEQTRRQMKDVEMVSLLLLLLEEGPKGYSQSDLDLAFSERETEWEAAEEVESRFRNVLGYLAKLFKENDSALVGTRLRNQADFYSLFGAVDGQLRSNRIVEPSDAYQKLAAFVAKVDDETERANDDELTTYYNAARSASNDKGPRELRISTIKKLLAS